MIENEHQQEQMPPQGKLVLPAYPDEGPNVYSGPQPQVRPDQLIQQRSGAYEAHSNDASSPKNPLAKMGYYWRKDPAYKVFIIAAVLVIVAGSIFVSLATAALVRNPNLFGSNNNTNTNTTPQNQTGPTPLGTVDLRPAFPTPGGGSGGNSSSQPPAQSTPVVGATATPVDSTTPTPQPTSGPGGGALTIELTNVPGQVNNNSTVRLNVATNEPGVTVRLQVSYNAYPFFYQSGAQVTGGGGNATLYWNVQVSLVRVKHVIARVTAVATDANGQYVTSATYTVQVVSGFGGGFVSS